MKIPMKRCESGFAKRTIFFNKSIECSNPVALVCSKICLRAGTHNIDSLQLWVPWTFANSAIAWEQDSKARASYFPKQFLIRVASRDEHIDRTSLRQLQVSASPLKVPWFKLVGAVQTEDTSDEFLSCHCRVKARGNSSLTGIHGFQITSPNKSLHISSHHLVQFQYLWLCSQAAFLLIT